jgi:pSer/pThr/pTyr-binding forkhead associated (FHA) protein
MKLIIEDDEGRRTVVPLFCDEMTIGRAEGSPVRLIEKDVSRRHAKLLRRGGRVYIEDVSRFGGVRVNGDRVHGPRLLREGDLIEISRYDLTLQGGPDEKLELDPRAGEEITAKVRRAWRGSSARSVRVRTFVVAFLVASALAAALWLRAARGAETRSARGAGGATRANAIADLGYDRKPSRDSAPPESRQ